MPKPTLAKWTRKLETVNLRAVEQAVISEALMRCNYVFGRAAKLLGVHRTTLRRKIREYGWK